LVFSKDAIGKRDLKWKKVVDISDQHVESMIKTDNVSNIETSLSCYKRDYEKKNA